MDLKVGSGKWRLTKRCGKGAFGQIFYGENCKTSEEVAIKLVSIMSNISLNDLMVDIGTT